ncbi:MAG: hypothetical protein ACRCTQ_04390 [Brevinemataceae bacterium]
MKKQLLLFTYIFCLTGCIKYYVLYQIDSPQKSLLSFSDILSESGLIPSSNNSNQTVAINSTEYPNAELLSNQQYKLSEKFHTLMLSENSQFTIKAETKNYLKAELSYSSKDIIMIEDLSTAIQGKFTFQIGKETGKIVINLYSPSNILEGQETWYIEINPVKP